MAKKSSGSSGQKGADSGMTTPGGDAGRPMKLGQMLIKQGVITQAELDKALAIQEKSGGFIGQIMVELGIIKDDVLVSFLVKQCKIPHILLVDYEISDEVLEIVPKEVCLKHNLLPIDKLGRILTVAMVDPLDEGALEDIREACPELRIKPILCTWEDFQLVSHRIFGGGPPGKSDDYDVTSLGLRGGQTAPQTAPAEDASQAAVSAAVEDVIREAGAGSAPAESEEGGEAAAPAQTPASIGEDLAEVVAGAVQEAIATVMVQMRASGGQEKAAPPRELTDAVREGVAAAAREAMASVASRLQAAEGQAPPPQELAEMVREGVIAAVQEAMATAMVQMRASEGQGKGAKGPSAGELHDMMRVSAHEALRESEAATVARANFQDLEAGDAARKRKLRHASVTPLGPEGNVAAALRNPEQRLESDGRVLAGIVSGKLDKAFTFETFFVGKTNEFTFKLCQAVAEKPGHEYNPFFLYGDVGLGKTHLITAMGHAVHATFPAVRIGYVSASRFATSLEDAMHDQAADLFRENYSHWEVLILDDIQFLGGRVEAQEELFHIFNVLQQEQRQIIIASDKAPDRLGLLERRLISRFSGGIVAQLKPPDWETRMAILRHHVQESKADVSDEALSLVAMRVPNDVRKMVGALRNVVAGAKLEDGPVSYERANEILNHLGIPETP